MYFKYPVKDIFNILNEMYQKDNQVLNSYNHSQNINTTQNFHFQFYNMKF
jgi:hypothetical protein